MDIKLTTAGYSVFKELSNRGKYPLFLTVSGSHANGLERPDSDIDIRGIYLDPTEQVLSLHRGADTVQSNLPGDVDFQCYELGKFLSMLLNHNGNMVRLVLVPFTLYKNDNIKWEEIARKFLTKSLRNYYRGYAQSQKKRAMSERGGKALIYVYREIFEGISIMKLGYPIFNFMQLWQWVKDNNFYNGGLLDHYFYHPKDEVTDEGWHQFYREWDELCLLLDQETEKSSLPDSYDGFNELNNLLLEWRKLSWTLK